MPLPYSVLIAGLGARVEAFLIPTLRDEGYQVQSCVGREALLATLNRSLDLVLLDLPAEDQIAEVGDVRAACPCALVVIGPARNDRLLISALEQGADDYVARPFRTPELLARIRAQLRRRRGHPAALTFGPVCLDLQGRQVCRDGEPLRLSTEEFTLLTLLAARPGSIYPASFIAEQIWGHGRRNDGDGLAVIVARLRTLIEPDPARPAFLGGDLDHGLWLGGIARERQLNGER